MHAIPQPKTGDEYIIGRVVENGEIEAHRAKLAKNKSNNPQPSKFMPQPTNEALLAQVSNIQSQLATERHCRIERAVNDLVGECRVTAQEAPMAIARAQADESYLAELRLRQQCLPGAAPLNLGAAVHTASDSVRNALSEISRKVSKPGEESMWNAAERSHRIGAVYSEARGKILPVMNAAAVNTIDAGLKRVLILQETVRDFAIRVLPLRLFSRMFQNTPLQGTDTVVVAYYPLPGAASQDFVNGDGTGGTGYQFGQATSTSSKTITVNKRKYQPLDYSSQEFRRQPWFDAQRLGKINAEKLGLDILLDVLSVFTPANFPTIAQADPTFNPNLNMIAATYSADQVDDLKTVATNLNWPDAGRSLITNTTIDNALGKDPAYKLALNIGTTDVIQEGKFPRLSGFDYATMPGFPGNGCNLQGLIAFASALATVFAPVDPAAGVRQQLVAYEIATDPATGISLNYRHWGVAQADRDYEVIESAYGYAALLARAAQLLTHP